MRRPLIGADPATSRAILIRVRNAGELARSQGAIASLAATIVPGTVEKKVYDEMAKKLADSLRANNVDAEISIVEPTKFKSATNGHIAQDVVVGAVVVSGVVGLLAIVYRLIAGRKHK